MLGRFRRSHGRVGLERERHELTDGFRSTRCRGRLLRNPCVEDGELGRRDAQPDLEGVNARPASRFSRIGYCRPPVFLVREKEGAGSRPGPEESNERFTR